VILVKKVAVLFPVASKTISPEAFAYFPVPMPVVVVDGIQPLTSWIYRFSRTIFFTSPDLGHTHILLFEASCYHPDL
jgi:hypothetical protein